MAANSDLVIDNKRHISCIFLHENIIQFHSIHIFEFNIVPMDVSGKLGFIEAGPLLSPYYYRALISKCAQKPYKNIWLLSIVIEKPMKLQGF